MLNEFNGWADNRNREVEELSDERWRIWSGTVARERLKSFEPGRSTCYTRDEADLADREKADWLT